MRMKSRRNRLREAIAYYGLNKPFTTEEQDRKAIMDFLVTTAKKDASLSETKRSKLYAFMSDKLSTSQEFDYAIWLRRQTKPQYDVFYAIKISGTSQEPGIIELLTEYSDIYWDTFNREEQKRQQEKSDKALARSTGRGNVEEYWGADLSSFLKWLNANTTSISIEVPQGENGDKALNVIQDMIGRLPNVDDFIEKVKTAPNNQLYPSWELQLKSNAYNNLCHADAQLAQKLSDWIIMKNDDLTFKPGPVFIEDQNKLTGNVIIKDLVYNYGFSKFIR